MTARSIEAISIEHIAALLTDGDYGTRSAVIRRGVSQRCDVLLSYIQRHQDNSGQPPTPGHLAEKFPTFNIPVANLPSSKHTEAELIDAYRRADVIEVINRASIAIRDDDTDQAERMITDYRPPAGATLALPHITLHDPSLYVADEDERIRLPRLGPALADGLGRGEYMLIGARTGVGKSWMLLMAALDAVEAGWDVMFLSLEMSAYEMAGRTAILLGVDRSAVQEWINDQSGELLITDQAAIPTGIRPSHLGRTVEAGSDTMLIVDYGELLTPDSGGRAAEGHHKSAEISMGLQALAKKKKIPVAAAVQENRSALVGGNSGVETFSGSDQWGRDTDLALKLLDPVGQLMSTMSPGEGPTRVLEVVKSRHSALRQKSHYSINQGGGGIELITQHDYEMLNEKAVAAQQRPL